MTSTAALGTAVTQAHLRIPGRRPAGRPRRYARPRIGSPCHRKQEGAPQEAAGKKPPNKESAAKRAADKKAKEPKAEAKRAQAEKVEEIVRAIQPKQGKIGKNEREHPQLGRASASSSSPSGARPEGWAKRARELGYHPARRAATSCWERSGGIGSEPLVPISWRSCPPTSRCSSGSARSPGSNWATSWGRRRPRRRGRTRSWDRKRIGDEVNARIGPHGSAGPAALARPDHPVGQPACVRPGLEPPPPARRALGNRRAARQAPPRHRREGSTGPSPPGRRRC